MSLDTVHVPVAPFVVQAYLKKLDEREEVHSFIVGIIHAKYVELELHRDGDKDAMTLRLNADGTWTAEHVLVVGEKR